MSVSDLLFAGSHPTVSPHQNRELLAVPDFLEIKQAVFSLGNNSAPGVDRFLGSFSPPAGILLVPMWWLWSEIFLV